MRWTPGNRGNIEDRRGPSGRAVPLGIGGFVLLLLLSWATGTDFLSLFTQGVPSSETAGPPTPRHDARRRADGRFRGRRGQRRPGNLGASCSAAATSGRGSCCSGTRSQSACGSAQSATGPFYCPGDRKVYLDLGVLRRAVAALRRARRFRAGVRHRARDRPSRAEPARDWASARSATRPGANSASVALELQADCFAGVWGHAASKAGRFEAGRVELEPGDAEEALRAAAAIGDDRLQRMSTGRVQPDRFTHGTSAQRVEWFQRGMDTGDPARAIRAANKSGHLVIWLSGH